MSILKALYTTVVDALFPISEAEQEVLAMSPLQAFEILPRAKKSPIPESCSLFSYKDDRVWRLIWCIKYKKSLVAAKIAGNALFQSLSVFARAAFPIIIVPMPITAWRRRERGFNQCELIADEIQRLPNITDQFMIVRDLLIRTRHKSRQTLKDREHRLESSRDVFAVKDEAAKRLSQTLIDNSNHLIIIIDDVVTTGSTIRDAVYTLRNAGFEKTFGLSVAH